MTNLIALATGTLLTGDYRIERVLGAGGFGVTYLAQELALSRAVTIKEYFPSDFAARQNGVDALPRSSDCAGDFQWGLDRFIEEAQALAKLDHPNIVRVYRYFRANSTAYMVLQFEEGKNFKTWLKDLGRAPRQPELDAIVGPLLDALEFVHKADYLHRDVAPDNIIVRRDGAPVLIDFGSARSDIIAHSRTVSALVKPGYSPYEQYAETSRQQGPWTDIYALGATLYHAVTGKRPPDSPSRMIKDEYVPAREAAVGAYRAGFLRAIDKSLMLQVEQRPKSIAAWRGDLLAPDPVRQGWFSRGRAAHKETALELAGAGAPAQVAPPGGFGPPLPDAPGPAGSILDYADRLKAPPAGSIGGSAGIGAVPSPGQDAKPVAKRKSKTAPPAKVAKAVAGKVAARTAGKGAKANAKPAAPPAKASVKKLSAKIAEAGAAVAAADTPAKKTTIERGTPIRPKPVSMGRRSGRFGLALKVAAAAGIAGLGLAYQDSLARLVTSGNAPAKSATASAIPDGPQQLREIRAHTGDVAGLAFSEDGRSIISAGRDASLKVWSSQSGTLQKTVTLDNRLVSSLALAGRRVVTGHGDGTIALYDIDKGERVAAYKRNDAEVWSVAFLGSGDRFAAASHDYQTAIWDTRNAGAAQFKLDGHTSSAQAVAYSVHGPWIATGSADKTVRLYDADTHDHIRTYKGAKDFVTALSFSPDGKSLAVASLDGDIRVYSTASNRQRFHLQGHKGKVGALAFSGNGDWLASAGEDGVVRLWNARKGRAWRSLTGHTGGATAVAFSPDSARLASAGVDGAVRVYSVPAAQRD
ncbi:MAG: serine/threonine protein kinase [Hyphomicrobiaceae bacterium]|nr:serine/threonine protein kinase [Hyphomicrobiaceae bacterium]